MRKRQEGAPGVLMVRSKTRCFAGLTGTAIASQPSRRRLGRKLPALNSCNTAEMKQFPAQTLLYRPTKAMLRSLLLRPEAAADNVPKLSVHSSSKAVFN